MPLISRSGAFLFLLYVGASLLAMDVNDNARYLDKRVALRFFASKLAPTVNLQRPSATKNARDREIGGVFGSGAKVTSL
jgi:predicted tellurium resistance membrane protein TerC